MGRFQRNWNVFGIGEPLLFPIKRTGQTKIHLARLLKEFFEFDGGKCTFCELKGEIIMDGCYNKYGVREKWRISKIRGCATPNEARNISPNFGRLHMTIKDADLVQSLKNLMAIYPSSIIDLAKIIGIGGEGTVLEDSKERLNLSILSVNCFCRFVNINSKFKKLFSQAFKKPRKLAVKFSVVRDGENEGNIIRPDIEPKEYDQNLKKSQEFLAAEKGLGPYVGFGLSDVHGTLTMAIG